MISLDSYPVPNPAAVGRIVNAVLDFVTQLVGEGIVSLTTIAAKV